MMAEDFLTDSGLSWLRAMLRATGDAMLVHGADGRIRAASAAAERLAGVAEGGLEGVSVDGLLGAQARALYHERVRGLAVESAPVEWEAPRRSGALARRWRLSLLPGPEPLVLAVLAKPRARLRAPEDGAEGVPATVDRSMDWLMALMDHAPVVIGLKSPPGLYVRANRQLGLLLGRPQREILGRSDRDLFPPEAAQRIVANDAQTLHAGTPMRFEERLPFPHGERTFIALKFPVYGRHGALEGIGVVATDVTEFKEVQIDLAREREKAVVTLSSIGEGVITCDPEGYVDYLNPVAESLTQWPLVEAAGRPLADVLRVMDERTRKTVDTRCYYSPDGCRFGPEDYHVVIGRDGARIPVQETASPMRGGEGQSLGAVIILRDVSASRQLARRLTYEARHDPLTGLINRAEFHRLLQKAINDARTERREHALCYLDLDNFKPVNDRAGHAAGDELLRQLTARLKAAMRKEDVFGRLGGDEFGVLLPNCDLDAAQRIAEGLRETVESYRLVWEGAPFQVTASIGIAMIGADSGDYEAVRAAADEAAYQAKTDGRNRVSIWRGHGASPAPKVEFDWSTRIGRALETNGFRLFCQQIVSLGPQDTTLRGEVLLRMKADDGGLIPPGSFLPAAERYELMPALDRWVIRNVFARAPREADVMLTINLSAQSLAASGLVEFIEEQAARHRVDPARFCFEISEPSVVAHYSQAQRLISRLDERGFAVSLDHFGSGYGAYDYLKRLPVDYLKIDGEFVRDMCRDRLDFAMVGSLNQIAHTLEKRTIADCVAEDSIVTGLRKIGVDLAQGFALARPQPLEEFGGYGR